MSRARILDTEIYQKIFIYMELNVASFASDYLKIEDYVVFVFCFRVKTWNKQREK